MAITLNASQLDMLRHQVGTIGLLNGLELLPFLEQLKARELDCQAWTLGDEQGFLSRIQHTATR